MGMTEDAINFYLIFIMAAILTYVWLLFASFVFRPYVFIFISSLQMKFQNEKSVVVHVGCAGVEKILISRWRNSILGIANGGRDYKEDLLYIDL